MDFINKAAQQYLHHGQGQQAPGQYQQPAPPSPQPPRSPVPAPQDPNVGLPPDWVAEWSEPDRRWFYVNRRTGERTWDRPSASHPGPPGGDPRQGLPSGWVAEWSAQDNRWFFVNTQTNERTWNHPGGPPPVQQTTVYSSGRAPGGGIYEQTQVTQTNTQPKAKNHNFAYGAAGAAAGLVGGAMLMHEGHKVGKLGYLRTTKSGD